MFGFKSPLTERLSVPAWLAAVVAATVILSYARVLRMPRDERRPLRPVFHVFAIVAPILFVASGAFIDAQSYRYLMPLHAALPVVYAVGIDAVWRTNRIAGATLLSILVAVFVLQQVDWYRRLEPDRETDTIINCLASSGIRAAYADYWLSYKLTFLTDERVIVAPTDGVDRYPPYTAAVRAQAGAPTIERRPAGSSCEEIVRTHR